MILCFLVLVALGSLPALANARASPVQVPARLIGRDPRTGRKVVIT